MAAFCTKGPVQAESTDLDNKHTYMFFTSTVVHTWFEADSIDPVFFQIVQVLCIVELVTR